MSRRRASGSSTSVVKQQEVTSEAKAVEEVKGSIQTRQMGSFQRREELLNLFLVFRLLSLSQNRPSPEVGHSLFILDTTFFESQHSVHPLRLAKWEKNYYA